MIEKFSNQPDDNWIRLRNGTQVHKTALIAPWVEFDDICVVHPYAIVGRRASISNALARQPETDQHLLQIGAGTIIGCHAVVYDGVMIGNECLIGDHALVREGSRIGNQCMIGCHVSISYDCKIGDRCRFQNGSVFHGECGTDCFFGIGVICSSDKRINLTNYQHLGSRPPIFGNRVMVGSGANILPEITIGDDVVIGAGTVVVKNVEAQSLVLGPAGKVSIPHVWV